MLHKHLTDKILTCAGFMAHWTLLEYNSFMYMLSVVFPGIGFIQNVCVRKFY